jgi:voltage-gated potassium channel
LGFIKNFPLLFNIKYFSKIFYAVYLLVLIIVIGTLGFMFIENWGLLNSFYMTIITISTVGFAEVMPLSDAGKVFTSLLIITSFGTFAFAVSSITSYLMGGEYKRYYTNHKLQKMVNKLEKHVIVCGLGRVGRQTIKELRAHNKSFVCLERDPEVVEFNRTNKQMLSVEGDATEDSNLLRAGIKEAQAIITTLPNDSDNLYVVLAAKELNPHLRVISRASKASSVKKLKIAGADHVIMPDTVGGSHMASLVIAPDVLAFLDNIAITGDAKVNLEEVSFSNLPEDFKYLTISELRARQVSGCNIIGYKTPDGEFVVNPDPDVKIVPNAKMFVLGTPEQIKKLNEVFHIVL